MTALFRLHTARALLALSRGCTALGSRLDHSHQMTMAARVTAAAKLVASLS
jgi:hypothetical protein